MLAKRPLGVILGIILCGFYLYALLPDALLLALTPLMLITAAVIYINKRLTMHRRIALLCLIFVLCGSLLRLFLGFFFQGRIDNDTYYAEAKIDEVTTLSDTQQMTATLTRLGGDDVSMKIIINYLGITEITSGDAVSFTGDFTPVYDADGNSTYYLSRGIVATCYTYSLTVENEGSPTLAERMRLTRVAIAERISALSSDGASGFTCAILLGDTSNLSERTSLAFSRLGITHILALSGTHISLLALAISKTLGKLGVSQKGERFILIFVIIAFMALVGFPSSVLRAGVMVIISSVLYLICSDFDTPTSLLIGVLIIILVEPYAVYDLGLLLSFLATLGIILCAAYIKEGRIRTRGIRGKAMMLVMFSVFSLCATALVGCFYFDKVSLASVWATAIFSILTEAVLYLGILVIALGGILPIGSLLNHLCSLTEGLCHKIADLGGLEFSQHFIPIRVLSVVIFILLIGFAVLKINKKHLFVGITVGLYCFTVTLGALLNIANTYDGRVVYEADKILITADGSTTLYDIGQHQEKEYFAVVSLLNSERIVELDTLCLLGLSNECDEYLKKILTRISVKSIELKAPSDGDELRFTDEISAVANGFGIEIRYADTAYEKKLGSATVMMHTMPEYSSLYDMCALTVLHNGRIFTYMTPDFSILSPMSELLIKNSDTLALGGYATRDFTYTPEVITENKIKVIIPDSGRVSTVLFSENAVLLNSEKIRVTE